MSDTWKALRKAIQGRSSRGLYEVLELKDWDGKKATFKERERVRYGQDSAIAHRDQGWGDGGILLNTPCTPGMPVEVQRTGLEEPVLGRRLSSTPNGESVRASCGARGTGRPTSCTRRDI